MSGRLLGRTVPVSGLTFTLGDSARIGAAPDNEVSLIAPGISEQHARIWSESGLVWVEDTGSATGTFLNGDRIVQQELVRHLDVITLGRHVDLIFVARATQTDEETITAASIEFLGVGAGKRMDVPKGDLTIGRGSFCDVVLPSELISRIHACLQRTSTQVILQDLESANGTFVNGERIEGPTALADRDVVSFGGQQIFSVAISGGEGQLAHDEPSSTDPARAKTRRALEPWEIDAMNASAAAAKARAEKQEPSAVDQTGSNPRPPRPGEQ